VVLGLSIHGGFPGEFKGILSWLSAFFPCDLGSTHGLVLCKLALENFCSNIFPTHTVFRRHPMANVVPAQGFNPARYVYNVERTGGACPCGQWFFYSATCGGVYQQYPNKCGLQRTRRGVNTAYCPGTAQRTLTGRVKVNAHCPSIPSAHHPHPWFGFVCISSVSQLTVVYLSASWSFSDVD